MSRTLALAIPLAAVLLSACATEPPPAPRTTAAEYAAWPQDRESSTLVFDPQITAACGMVPTAHFGFDSDAIVGDAAAALDRLSECFITGPLAGKVLRIVGHTDPRGDPGHNLVLGQKRATGVAFYLNAHGFDLLNAHTMTVGSADAVGTDEETWALDRKVEVFLEN